MSLMSLIKGIGIGAAGVYLFDPLLGNRRRSRLRDQFVSAMHGYQDFFDRGVRDLSNRCTGLLAETRGKFSHENLTDEQLVQRVRATMGHYVSHPRAIDVSVENGTVCVSGPILAKDVHPFLTAIKHVRGVQRVENQLEVHEGPDISSLQGETRRAASADMLHSNWAPGFRLLGAAAGLGLMANCAMKRNPVAVLGGVLGFGLFCRATCEESTLNWFGGQAWQDGRGAMRRQGMSQQGMSQQSSRSRMNRPLHSSNGGFPPSPSSDNMPPSPGIGS